MKLDEKKISLLLYIFKRLLIIIPLLLLIISIVFILLNFAPGDPAIIILGPEATEERILQVREELGLNNPWYVQYWDFLKKIIFERDLGRSYQTGRPVTSEIARTLPISLEIAFFAMLLTSFVGILVGVLSAVKQYSFIDNLVRIIVLAGVSMPLFWLGLVTIVIFSVYLGWFPSSGWGGGAWQFKILPVVTLSAYSLALIARLTRSTMLEVLQQNYIRTARAKGLAEKDIVFKHTLRNAFIPVITTIGVQFGVLISGSVLTETVFAIPGLGRLTVNAVFARDYPIIQGTIIVSTVIFTLINLLVDLSYTLFDPRIRY